MKLYLSCLLLVGVAAALPWDLEEGSTRSAKTSCNCGWSNRGRIVGGKETQKNEYPLIVAIQDRLGQQFCGGTIITPWHVLTAAHCTEGEKAKKLRINVGAHKLGFFASSEGVYSVARIIDHEEYDKDKVVNDISLLLTASQIKFNQNVGPACLPSGRLNIENQSVRALGWGLTTDKGRPSKFLQEVDLRIIGNNACRRFWKDLRSTNVCSHDERKDTCQGDSGGPLIWLDPDTNRYTIAALVSYGAACGSGVPGVNTDVSAYLDWIERNVRASKSDAAVCKKI